MPKSTTYSGDHPYHSNQHGEMKANLLKQNQVNYQVNPGKDSMARPLGTIIKIHDPKIIQIPPNEIETRRSITEIT